jgi:hypothetical protein
MPAACDQAAGIGVCFFGRTSPVYRPQNFFANAKANVKANAKGPRLNLARPFD